MRAVVLTGMTPAQQQGWMVLLDLTADFPDGWCVIGGQMVWVHAQEQGIDPPRITEDIDIVVDVRARPGGVGRLCGWLEKRNFRLSGINAHGIGHRYVRDADPGPGRITFDVLAPDGLGERADVMTTPPARTVAVPGSRAALDDVDRVAVAIGGREGNVPCPSLLAAILIKAAATTIPTRQVPLRDLADVAFLLTMVADPIEMAEQMTRTDRRKLRTIGNLLDDTHAAWRPLGARALLGQTTLRFLLDA